jgi:hypothetical protein
MLAGPDLFGAFGDFVGGFLDFLSVIKALRLVEVVDGPVSLKDVVRRPSAKIVMITAHLIDHFLNLLIVVPEVLLPCFLFAMLLQHYLYGKMLVPFLKGKNADVDDTAPWIMSAAGEDA